MKIWVVFLVLSVFGICTGRFVSFTGEKFGDRLMHDVGDLAAYLMVALFVVAISKVLTAVRKDKVDV